MKKMDEVRGLFALCAGIHGKIKTTMANGRKSLEIRKKKKLLKKSAVLAVVLALLIRNFFICPLSR
ncbi:hypothetical protein B938_11085 [Bacillus velezensis AS43.3]|nr:hypothetical protein B938_11085 [Bacillus velezensis AS43.3]